MCFPMLKKAAILSLFDNFEKKTSEENQEKKANYKLFCKKMIINDLKSWVFAEIVCSRN